MEVLRADRSIVRHERRNRSPQARREVRHSPALTAGVRSEITLLKPRLAVLAIMRCLFRCDRPRNFTQLHYSLTGTHALIPGQLKVVH